MSWLENLEVRAKVGDIVTCGLEALLVTCRVGLSFYGKIGKRLLSLCGQVLEGDLQRLRAGLERGVMPPGQVVPLELGPAYPLGATRLILFGALWADDNLYTRELYRKLFSNAIRAALQCRVNSLAVPILKERHEMLAEVVVEVLRQFDRLKDSEGFPIEEIAFVSDNQVKIDYLNSYFKKKL